MVVGAAAPEMLAGSNSLDGLAAFYRGRRVLVTGHTGFKGGWLTAWLAHLGADVAGLALPPEASTPSLYHEAGIERRCRSYFVDVRDSEAVARTMADERPEVVFHLAARALVQQGYDDPLATFATNAMGTANVLEAARRTASVAAVVCVTTDKVYRNYELPWPNRESDELGGLDAYAASKAAAEMIARAYRHALNPKDRPVALATARGGNVVGGGDFSPHRLIPDVVRALSSKTPLVLRHPKAIRPWQHVLDLCLGYLALGRSLALDGKNVPEALNFGPRDRDDISVGSLVRTFLTFWGEANHQVTFTSDDHYEANVLRLDSSLARQKLGWRAMLDASEAIEWSANWYRAHAGEPTRAGELLDRQLSDFEARLKDAAV